jgi:hypothetical protein
MRNTPTMPVTSMIVSARADMVAVVAMLE